MAPSALTTDELITFIERDSSDPFALELVKRLHSEDEYYHENSSIPVEVMNEVASYIAKGEFRNADDELFDYPEFDTSFQPQGWYKIDIGMVDKVRQFIKEHEVDYNLSGSLYNEFEIELFW